MFDGGPTHTIELRGNGDDVTLTNSYSDGSSGRIAVTPRQAPGRTNHCAWSGSEGEWFEITDEGLRINDADGFIRLVPSKP